MKRFIRGLSADRIEGALHYTFMLVFPCSRSRDETGYGAGLHAGRSVFGLTCLMGVLWPAILIPGPALAEKSQPGGSVAQHIHFISQEAGEVILVWGIDGWKVLPEPQRPAGTVIEKAVMRTPMTKVEDHFSATLKVAPDSMLDFGFLITRTNRGVDVQVWEGEGDDAFHQKGDPHRAITVHSKANLLQSSKAPPDRWTWFPYLVITMLCVALPFGIAMRLIRRRRYQWHRRMLLPTFKKPPRPTKAGDAALVGISLVVGIVLAEILLYAIDPHGGFGAARQLDWVRTGGPEIDKSVLIDPELGLRPRLNHGLYNDYGTVANTYSIEKPPGTVRVLVLGSQAVFSGQFVEALHRFHQDQVEIWNGGVPSYGTMQTINFYRKYQSRIQADKIILVMATIDLIPAPITYRDNRQNIVALVPYSARSSLNSFLFTYSHIYRLIAGIRTVLTNPEQSVLREIQAGLSDLGATLKREDKELFVVSLPLMFPEEMWSIAEKERHAAMLEMLKNTPIPHIDLLPPFRSALQEKLDVRQHAGNPFEPTLVLAEHFISYLDEHGLGQTIEQD